MAGGVGFARQVGSRFSALCASCACWCAGGVPWAAAVLSSPFCNMKWFTFYTRGDKGGQSLTEARVAVIAAAQSGGSCWQPTKELECSRGRGPAPHASQTDRGEAGGETGEWRNG